LHEMLGRIVYSKSGRDKGKMFVIIGIVDENFVLLADGDLRKIENPKLKNIKHVQMTNMIAEDILSMINKGVLPDNHIIKKILKNIQETWESAGRRSGNGER
jgi:large subunit ribosomal protein L14e